MTSTEALAIARLRQWGADRVALRSAKVAAPEREYSRSGDKIRRTTVFNARQVRVIDFERALGKLTSNEICTLVLKYRDRHTVDEIAQSLGCSPRTVSGLLPQARAKLADELDRLNLL